jgi:hypothetical protein
MQELGCVGIRTCHDLGVLGSPAYFAAGPYLIGAAGCGWAGAVAGAAAVRAAGAAGRWAERTIVMMCRSSGCRPAGSEPADAACARMNSCTPGGRFLNRTEQSRAAPADALEEAAGAGRACVNATYSSFFLRNQREGGLYAACDVVVGRVRSYSNAPAASSASFAMLEGWSAPITCGCAPEAPVA